MAYGFEIKREFLLNEILKRMQANGYKRDEMVERIEALLESLTIEHERYLDERGESKEKQQLKRRQFLYIIHEDQAKEKKEMQKREEEIYRAALKQNDSAINIAKNEIERIKEEVRAEKEVMVYDVETNRMVPTLLKGNREEYREETHMKALMEIARSNVDFPGTMEHFYKLTGRDREEAWSEMDEFGMGLKTLTAESLMMVSMLNKGLSIEEIEDKDAKKEVKEACVKTFFQTAKAVNRDRDSEEYQDAKYKMTAYALDEIVQALPKMEEYAKTLQKNKDILKTPEKLYNTKEGRMMMAFANMAYDIQGVYASAIYRNALRIYTEHYAPDVYKNDPDHFYNRLANLGLCVMNYKLATQMTSVANEILQPSLSIDSLIDQAVYAKLTNDQYDAIEVKDHEPLVIDPKNMEDVTVDRVACLNFLNSGLMRELRNRYSKEEVCNAVKDGRLLKSIQIKKDDQGKVKSLSVLGIQIDKTGRITDPDGNDLQNNLSPKLKEEYLKRVETLYQTLKETDNIVSIKRKTDFKKTLEQLELLMTQMKENENFTFRNIQDGLFRVSVPIEAYIGSHQSKNLTDKQKKRLKAMDELLLLKEFADRGERQPGKPDRRTRACENLTDTQFKLERLVASRAEEKEDGLQTLSKRAIQSVKFVRNLLKKDKEFTDKEKEKLKKELKVIYIGKVIAAESGFAGNYGRISEAIRKLPKDKVDAIIDMYESHGLEDLQGYFDNPTREAIDELFSKSVADGIINDEIGKKQHEYDVKRRETIAKKKDDKKKTKEKEEKVKSKDNKKIEAPSLQKDALNQSND